MSVVVIAPPAPLVELDLVKQHLRVDHDDDDTLIAALLAAASANIDGPDGWLGRAIGLQTLELRQDGFYAPDWRVGQGYAWEGGWTGSAWGRWPFARIQLPLPPFVDVLTITYEVAAGADQVLGPSGWTATDEGVTPAAALGWPGGRVAANAVRIRYRAGYVDADGNPQTPAPIAAAVLMMTADLYATREASVIDATRATQVTNPTAQALLQPFRIWRV